MHSRRRLLAQLSFIRWADKSDHMAIYIQLSKFTEDAHEAIYRFGPAEELIGSVCIDKKTGDVQLLEIDRGDAEFYLSRVRRVLVKHFEFGAFPETTHYAA